MTTDLLPDLEQALAGRYHVLRELGVGGMATVYLAEDRKHHRRVALKVLKPELAQAIGPERFLHEIATTAQLTHPNILSLHESGEVNGTLYYTMPHLEGESLRSRLNRERDLSIDDALQITTEVAEALDYAHSKGIIHRDIKPENIILQDGHAVVVDFGIARAVQTMKEDALTEPGLAMGTPAYMSPEQAAARDALDGRSDVYALGCVLYEMLAGQPPYAARTPQALIAKKLSEPIPRISVERDTVPPPVEAALTKALAKNPTDRFPTASAFAAALAMHGEAVEPTDLDKANRVGSGRPGILVIPFSDLSVNRDAGHVSDGLTDEIITGLSSVPAIRVISRSASMRLKYRPPDAKDLRSGLNVEYVLEGTVCHSSGSLRITAQLTRADDSEVLWAHKYTGMIADLLDIEEQIARRVVEGLSIKLGQKEEQRLAARPVPDAAAYEHYLRAKHAIYRFTEEALDEALVYLEKGLALGGDSVPLYAAMGYVYWQYVNAGIRPDPVYLEKAVTCADRILEMDPDASEGHRLKGLVAIHAKGDIQETVRHLKRAADCDPNNTDTLFWLALFYGFAGRPSSGHALAERLLALDPITPFHWLLPGYLCILEGDFARARPQMQKAYELTERSAPIAQSYAQLLLMAGDESAARTVVAQMGEDDPESFFTKLGQCFIAAIDGTDVDPAIMAEVRDGAQADAQYSWSLAACYALRGHADLAIDWLTNSVRRGNWNYPLIAERDPLLASLRTDDRFTTLMREVRQKWLSFDIGTSQPDVRIPIERQTAPPLARATVTAKPIESKVTDRRPTPHPFAAALPVNLNAFNRAARRKRRYGWAAALTMAIAGVGLILWAALRTPSQTGPFPADRPYVLLADVAGTADSVTRDVVAFALRTALDASYILQSVPPDHVQGMIELMELEETAPVEGQTAHEVAARFGIASAVLPRLDRTGRTWVFTVRVEDVATDQLLTTVSAQAATDDALTDVIDAVVRKLRRDLGESRSALVNTEPLPQLLTSSLEALRLYHQAELTSPGPPTDGYHRWLHGVPSLREALALDPDFAAARVALGMAFSKAGFADSAITELRRALEMPDRLDPVVRRETEAWLQWQGDFALWDERMLRSGSVRQDAFMLSYFNDFESALTMQKELVRETFFHIRRFHPEQQLDTDSVRYLENALAWAIASGRFEELDAFRDSLGLPPGLMWSLESSLAANDWARAEDLLAADLPIDDAWLSRPTGEVWVTPSLDPVRGRIRAAHERQGGSWLALMLEAVYGLPSNDTTAAQLTARRAEPVMQFIRHGYRAALAGDTAEARRVITRLRAARDSATSVMFERAFLPLFALLEASIPIHAGDWDAAVEILEPAASKLDQRRYGYGRSSSYLVRWVLADVYAHLGRFDAAIEQLEGVLRASDDVGWHTMTYSAVHFRLGQLQARVGDVVGSVGHFKTFLTAFTDPDSEYVWMVDEALAAMTR